MAFYSRETKQKFVLIRFGVLSFEFSHNYLFSANAIHSAAARSKIDSGDAIICPS